MPLRGSWAASVSLSAPLLLSTRGLERASKLPLMSLADALLISDQMGTYAGAS